MIDGIGIDFHRIGRPERDTILHQSLSRGMSARGRRIILYYRRGAYCDDHKIATADGYNRGRTHSLLSFAHITTRARARIKLGVFLSAGRSEF